MVRAALRALGGRGQFVQMGATIVHLGSFFHDCYALPGVHACLSTTRVLSPPVPLSIFHTCIAVQRLD